MPDSLNAKIDRSISFIFALNFAWNFLVIQAITVPFYTSKGLSPQQIISIGTVFSVTLLLLDVPTGYLADRYGRRRAILAAGFFKGLGGTILLLFQNYTGFVAAFIAIGIGNSLFSGADLALLTQLNSLKGNEAKPMSALLSTRLSMNLLGVASSAIIGGLVANVSFQIAMTMNCVIAWTSFGIAFFIKDIATHPADAAPARASFAELRELVLSPARGFRSLLLVRIGLLTILTIHAAVLQLLWQKLDVPLVWFGFLSAFHALVGAGLSQLIARQRAQVPHRVLMILVASLPVAAFLGGALGSYSVLVGLSSGLLIEAYRAIVSARLNAFFNEGLPKHLIATGNSCASMGSRLAFVSLSPLVGLSLKTHGVPATFSGLALVSALFGLSILGLPLLTRSNEEENRLQMKPPTVSDAPTHDKSKKELSCLISNE